MHYRDIKYAVGKKVLLSTRNLSLKQLKKLHNRYVGPFEVLKRLGPATAS